MRSTGMTPELHKVLSAFFVNPDHVRAEPLGDGNINDTWLVADRERRFVLQRINSTVFPAPYRIIENFKRVTNHISGCRKKSGHTLVCPGLVKTRQGGLGFCDGEGWWWRAQTYIQQGMPSSALLEGQGGERLGRVLAWFHMLTAGLDPECLHRPLPDFHVTPVYLEKYEKCRTRKLHRPETEELRDCFRFVERFSDCAAVLESARIKGRLQLRTIHGDPKLDNFIIAEDGFAAGLLDLDTAGPGLIHYDLGDCLRSVCNRTGEHSRAPEDIVFDADICRSVLKGYLEERGNSLSGWERHYIYDAILAITFELGLRFLTDYLMGDVYFKVNSEGENLQRARVQFALAGSITEQRSVIRKIAESF